MLAEFPGFALVLQVLLRSIAYATAIFAALFCVIALLELRQGSDLSRYRSRNFANDVAYGFFYQGGFYNVLVWAPIAALLTQHLGFARLDLLSTLPLPLAYAIFWLTADFIGYWYHRLQHANRWLWEFHSVHHSQERMTFVTSNRLHLLDILPANLAALVPITLLGVPSSVWMPFYFAQQFLEYVQHADLPWRYGPLYRWLVSPWFHAIHHARERDRYDHNFGKMLSVWDFVFGTADSGSRPRAYGLADVDMPENLWRQLVVPFGRLTSGESRPLELARR